MEKTFKTLYFVAEFQSACIIEMEVGQILDFFGHASIFTALKSFQLKIRNLRYQRKTVIFPIKRVLKGKEFCHSSFIWAIT